VRREAKRTVLTAEAVDGADEAAVELARPPQPGHRGPVVPPRCRRPVPPAAGAAHLSRRSAQAASGDDDLRTSPSSRPPLSREAVVRWSRARWPRSRCVASYNSTDHTTAVSPGRASPSWSVSWLHRPGCLYSVGRQGVSTLSLDCCSL
jgi:hypothetical protein